MFTSISIIILICFFPHAVIFKVRVLAADGGTPSLTSTAVVRLFVERNLRDPTLLQQNYTFTIFETQVLGVGFGQINAQDLDITVSERR